MADYQLTQTGQQVQTALNKVGTATLTTTATDLSGAVNELNTTTTNLQSSITSLTSQKANVQSPTLYTPQFKFGLKSNSDAYTTSTPRVEFRRVGNTGTYGCGWVYYDTSNNSTFYTVFGENGDFLPGYKLIRGIQEVTVSTSSSIADKGTTTLSGTMTNVSGATNYYFVPRYLNYGIYTGAVSKSGTSISVSAMNVSGASHTMSGSVLVIAI